MKKVVSLFLVFAMLLTMSSVACAANWSRVFSDEDEVIHIDTSSVRRGGNVIEVKCRRQYVSYQMRAAVGLGVSFNPASYGQRTDNVSYGIEVLEFKKNEDSYRRTDGGVFNNKGKMICPMNTSDWKTCGSAEKAIREACLKRK